MKRSFIITVLLMVMSTGFSQELQYDVRADYTHAVKKEILVNAQQFSDIIPYYPEEWVKDYISTEISIAGYGKSIAAMGSNGKLTAEQQKLLNTVELGMDIVISIRYRSRNSVTGVVTASELKFPATIVPEKEAEYAGGKKQLTQYLKEYAISKISEKVSKQTLQAVVKFTVNEQGEIANTRISKSSGDAETDQLLIDAIKKMPKWKPAQNAAGVHVQQEFQFSVTNEGC